MLRVETERYTPVFGLLSTWRNENTDKNGYKGILPFVTGLRFSVQLLYIIKDLLTNSNLDAAWGHIVDKKGSDAVYSNECDIIIYKKVVDSVARCWNGHTKGDYKSMDFKFIKAHAVVGVISCKAHINASKIDKKYPSQLRKFTRNVWLFAEYSNFKSYPKIRAAAKKLGYSELWCFYEWNEKQKPEANIKSWGSFDKKIITLAEKNALVPKKSKVKKKKAPAKKKAPVKRKPKKK